MRPVFVHLTSSNVHMGHYFKSHPAMDRCEASQEIESHLSALNAHFTLASPETASGRRLWSSQAAFNKWIYSQTATHHILSIVGSCSRSLYFSEHLTFSYSNLKHKNGNLKIYGKYL